MRKIYFKILVGIVILLWVIYFIQSVKEGFTPRIRGMYRPYVRTINKNYESFMNNYGKNVIMTKLRKWNIY